MLPVCLFSQIKLPKGFKCIKTEIPDQETHFGNTRFDFYATAWSRDIPPGKSAVDFLQQDIYKNKLRFQKTKDSLYWATGKYGGSFIYTVLIPEEAIEISVSGNKGNELSTNSKYLLSEIRKIRQKVLHKIDADNTCFCLTDYKGDSCY